MILSTPQLLRTIGVLLVLSLSGCSDYSHDRDVEGVPGLFSGNLVLFGTTFDYYKVDGLRSRVYVIYFKDRSFFDLNEAHITLTFKGIKVNSGTDLDMMIYFTESSYSLSFDYDLAYDYVQFETGEPLVADDGLINEERGVYMLRIRNFKSEN